MIIFQRLESALILLALLTLYRELDYSWLWFATMILLPDVSMLGYLKNPQVGAIIYNIGHSYFSPVILWFISHHLESDIWIVMSIVWAIHIAADRLLGFGLKSTEGFKFTHLGKLK